MANLLLAIIYLAFISLGLPDSLLGAAWPSMYGGLNVPLSYAGIISMIISLFTIVSSLMSDTLTRKLGTGKLTAFSVLVTTVALFGFSVSGSFAMLCLFAIPYGLGAGSVDAALNNYVAVNYASRHMSWLHCMWGVGASLGPIIMSYALTGGGWPLGYRYVAILQAALTIVLLCSLPLWKKRSVEPSVGKNSSPLSLKEVVAIPGAKAIMLAFFCYCALEQTCGLWASSFLVLTRSFDKTLAARVGSMLFIGVTLGRAISGFLTFKLTDTQLIRFGMAFIGVGIVILFLPYSWSSIVALSLIGLGASPIYPCIIHSTPEHFGAERSQALVGVQMASAYTGTCLMPPLFGLIANHVSAALFPVFLGLMLCVAGVAYERLLRSSKR